MGMVVQHNISAMNANEAMRKNVSGLKKQTEKLSTGYNINRAADNAAGLAISEKMRSQIRGLTQASSNANDAISLIQTAEGGLQETEDIMQRMRELAVQSANGTYTDEDREQIQYEVDALKAEVDRISESTEFNEMKLLDGSLSNTEQSKVGEYGPSFASINAVDASTIFTNASKGQGTIMITSDKLNTQVKMGVSSAVEEGSEIAVWDAAGQNLTITLAAGKNYTEDRLNEIIAGAQQEGSTATSNVADVKITLGANASYNDNSGLTTKTPTGTNTSIAAVSLTATAAGTRANNGTGTAFGGTIGTDYLGANKILFKANKYGQDFNDKITVQFDAGTKEDGKTIAEGVTTKEDADSKIKADGTYQAGEYVVHLHIGKEYSAEDIEQIMNKAGLDYSVALEGPAAEEVDGTETIKAITATAKTAEIALTNGTGWSADDIDNLSAGPLDEVKDKAAKSKGGLTFQIGANGVEDQRLTVTVENMGSKALGIDKISVAKQDDANDAINKIDDAIKAVSTQRAKLGAVQNRLEHTVNSLNTANENMTASESQIRDTDMASEMIKYTKSNILQQASQSMLAQANQQPQGVLQLLG